MPEMTATQGKIKLDADLHAAMRFADGVVHLLRNYISDHSIREARDALIEAALEQGFELTSKAMRKEYEAWKSTQIQMLHPSPAT